jgi:hypothetical protein
VDAEGCRRVDEVEQRVHRFFAQYRG